MNELGRVVDSIGKGYRLMVTCDLNECTGNRVRKATGAFGADEENEI